MTAATPAPRRVSTQTAARTDVGRRRTENEDAFGLFDDLRVYVVADGLGGHRGGRFASALAVETIHDVLTAPDDDDLTPTTDTAGRSSIDARRVQLAIEEANARVQRAGETPEHQGMGTTVAVVALDVAYGVAAVCHVGDTRVFRVRDGAIEQLTEDHTVVQEWVKAGRMAPEDARSSPHRHVVTQALGTQPRVRPHLRLEPLHDGDVFVLSSDGIHDVVATDEIAGVLADAGTDVAAACERLVELANQRGGRDNATVIVVRCRVEGDAASP